MKKITDKAGRIKEKCLNTILPAIYLLLAFFCFALALFLPSFIDQGAKLCNYTKSYTGSKATLTHTLPTADAWRLSERERIGGSDE